MRIRTPGLRSVSVLILSAALLVGFGGSKLASVGASAPAEASVWVQKPDGGAQCEPGTARSLEEGAKELAKAGVRVLSSRKGSDGQMRIQLCGSPTGAQNIFEIPATDLEKAKSLGFTPVKSSQDMR